MDLASEQTATYSFSHGDNVDGVGARSGYRPDPQPTLRQFQKFNAVASNNRDQIEVQTFGIKEVGPISGRTKAKRSFAAAAAGSQPDGATFGAQRGARTHDPKIKSLMLYRLC